MFDTHTHLTDEQYDKDREEVIERAKKEGIEILLDCGWDIQSSREVVKLTEKHRNIYGAVGVHPHETQYVPKDYLDIIEELANNKKIKAIGEIGLDYYKKFSPSDSQLKVFKEQLLLAKKLSLPVIIHSRKAVLETIDIVKEIDYTNGVFHALSTDFEIAKKIIDMGFYIAVNGSLTFNSKRIKQWLPKVPSSKILLETDSPYLTPSPMKGKRNEPSFLKLLLNPLSEILGLSGEIIAKITQENGKKLFSIIL